MGDLEWPTFELHCKNNDSGQMLELFETLFSCFLALTMKMVAEAGQNVLGNNSVFEFPTHLCAMLTTK
jgi:hypothetical protein